MGRRRMMVEVGQRFGRLTVIKDVGIIKRHSRAECLCDCGTTKIVAISKLKSGWSRSCGCLSADLLGDLARTHGEANKTAEWQSWRGMINRCYCPSNSVYHRYGAVGISVHEEWRSNFLAFLQHVGRSPSNKHSIDRIDNRRGYEPGNVRWATHHEQARNRCKNVIIEFNGESMCIAAWTEKLGFQYNTLQRRIKRGWSIEKALTTPLRER